MSFKQYAVYSLCTNFFSQTLNRGDLVYVDDGLISLKVTEKTDKTLITSLLPTSLIISLYCL